MCEIKPQIRLNAAAEQNLMIFYPINLDIIWSYLPYTVIPVHWCQVLLYDINGSMGHPFLHYILSSHSRGTISK